MKRFFAALLAALMVLSLAACGSKEPSIHDELTALPEETPAEKPEKPAEKPDSHPVKEEKPSRLEKEPEPESQETSSEEPMFLADRLEGNYTRTVDNPDGPEHEDVQVRLIGDLISVEWGSAMGEDLQSGDYYTFGAYDLQPKDPSLLYSYTETTLPCIGIYYSLQVGSWAEEPADMELTLDGDVLLFNGERYERTEAAPVFHDTPAELQEMIGVQAPADTGELPIGQWVGNLDGMGLYLNLCADGTLDLCTRPAGGHMCLCTGVYEADVEKCRIDYTAEQVGSGTMPITGILTWERFADGTLGLGIVGKGQMPVWSAPEFWSLDGTFGGLLTEFDFSEELVVDDVTYAYHAPYLNCCPAAVNGINQLILDQFGELVRLQKDQLNSEGYCEFPEVHWSAARVGDLLSIQVWANAFTYFREYGTWYHDLTTHENLSTAEILPCIGMSEKEFLDLTRTCAEEYYAYVNRLMTDEQREEFGYDYFLEQTLSEESIHPGMMSYLDGNGTLHAVVPLGTMAGAGYCYTPICVAYG